MLFSPWVQKEKVVKAMYLNPIHTLSVTLHGTKASSEMFWNGGFEAYSQGQTKHLDCVVSGLP